MAAVASQQDAADSIAAWSASEKSAFNGFGYWVVSVSNPTGTAPNTPSEVQAYLGTEISTNSEGVTDKLLAMGGSVDARMGAVASGGHNPCR